MKLYTPISDSFLFLLASAAIFGLGACAHGQVISPEQLSASEGPVRAAVEAGAEKIPSAALYLKLAREELILGKSLDEKGNKRAVTVLERAQADAELALALAQESTTEGEARKLMEEVKAATL